MEQRYQQLLLDIHLLEQELGNLKTGTYTEDDGDDSSPNLDFSALQQALV